jgi:hypothetical protein
MRMADWRPLRSRTPGATAEMGGDPGLAFVDCLGPHRRREVADTRSPARRKFPLSG